MAGVFFSAPFAVFFRGVQSRSRLITDMFGFTGDRLVCSTGRVVPLSARGEDAGRACVEPGETHRADPGPAERMHGGGGLRAMRQAASEHA